MKRACEEIDPRGSATDLLAERAASTPGSAPRRRSADALPVQLALDTASGVPLHKQIYSCLRSAIVEGRLRAGDRLPSTRVLAADLGVGRATVLIAFERLLADGLVVACAGAGTRVAKTVVTACAPQPMQVNHTGPDLGRAGETLVAGVSNRPGLHSHLPFSMGVPLVDLFPSTTWSRLMSRRWRTTTHELLLTSDPAGHPALREAIARYVATARGLQCGADQVVVTSGAHEGVDLAARLLIDPGETVWCEQPGSGPARAALAATGARVVDVPVDAEGFCVEEALRRAPSARLAFVTPAVQAPTGVTMSAARRAALVAWAAAEGAWIVEDDVGGEYHGLSRHVATLHRLDRAERVIHVGSFNHVLFPALRIGYAVLPARLATPFARARLATRGHAPTLAQAVLADFFAGGHFARHIRRLRELYLARHARFFELAGRVLEGLIQLDPTYRGPRILGRLAPGLDDQGVAAAAAARGVIVQPLSVYTPGQAPVRGGLLLGYATFSDSQLRVGARQLADAISAAAAASRLDRAAG